MGTSTDGMLYFGFPIGEEDEDLPLFENNEVDDIQELCYKEAGLTTNPWDLPDGKEKDDLRAARSAAYDNYPVEVETYCHSEYPMYFLVIGNMRYRVSRGEALEIPGELPVPQTKIDAAKSWCETHDVEWQEPKWYLLSYWG